MSKTYEDILSGRLSPEAIKLQMLHDNARLGINTGWQIASKLSTSETSVEEVTALARHLSKEITKDYNEAMKITEVKSGSDAKTPTSQLS